LEVKGKEKAAQQIKLDRKTEREGEDHALILSRRRKRNSTKEEMPTGGGKKKAASARFMEFTILKRRERKRNGAFRLRKKKKSPIKRKGKTSFSEHEGPRRHCQHMVVGGGEKEVVSRGKILFEGGKVAWSGGEEKKEGPYRVWLWEGGGKRE